MTVTVGLFEAKTHLSALVDRISHGGDDVVITRRGKPVARLVPVESASPVDEALSLLLAARAASAPGRESVRELIDDGRDR
jgi:prevent-host-death family protein